MLIDLSVALNENTPAYPGDPVFTSAESATLAANGYVGHGLTLGTHTGTHIDAPAHMLADGQTLDAYELTTFVGHGKLIDGFSIEAVTQANLQPGDIALFNTGTSSRLHEPSYFTDYPVMGSDIAELLISLGVKLVGLDTCSADSTPDFTVHKQLLGARILIIENLTNLQALQGFDFEVIALPLKLALDGAPARVVAVVVQ